MGCNIHAVFQAWRNGVWQDVESEFDEPRDYFLFAWLAGVRNGHGFAGVPTHAPIVPLSEPRGLPRDFEADGTEHNGKWLGDHSHSWLTANEILRSPTPDRVWRTGVISIEAFRAWVGFSPPPGGRSGDVFGRDVRIAQSPVDVQPDSTHVRVYWVQSADKLRYFTDEIRRLQDEHGDDVRMVFGFDS
jgi:hypothetical protein